MAESYTDVSAPEHIKCAGRDAVLLTSYTPAQDDAAQDADSAAPLQTEAPDSVDADGEEAETSEEGLWVMIAYIDYDEDHCIYIHINADAELTDDQTQGYLDAIGDALVIESR